MPAEYTIEIFIRKGTLITWQFSELRKYFLKIIPHKFLSSVIMLDLMARY